MSGTAAKKLRIVTYLVPDIPVEVFETIMLYLEETLGVQAHLICESRWNSPPPNRNLFDTDEVDIGFMSSSGFLDLMNSSVNIELCRAGALHEHNFCSNRPVYFADVIYKANSTEYKEFHDLKGHTWAYSDSSSLSGTLIVLAELKKMGTNSSFFGHILQSGNHLTSIRMVLNGQADAAAVDSKCLRYFLQKHPYYRKDLKVLTSLGPMPTYPVVFNKRLPAEFKKRVTEAFLQMSESPEWNAKLQSLSIRGFVPTDMSLYQMEKEIIENVKGLTILPTYY